MRSIQKGLLLATAATLMLTTQTFAGDSTATQAKPVKCFGINSCRGKGQCGMKGKNACSGQNSCKGKGWLYTKTEQMCTERNGKVEHE